MKKKNKKKIILSISSVALLIGIGASSIYFQDGKNSLYHNISESIIAKQPNINTMLEDKVQKEEIKQEEKIDETQKKQEVKTSNINSNSNSNQTKKQTNKVTKTSNVTSNKTSNSTSNKTSNSTSSKTSNKSVSNSNRTSNKVTTITGNFNQAEAKKLLNLVNKVRKENGLKEVTWNNSLENSAKIRAKETSSKFNHTRPNGYKYNTAIAINYKTSGENVAAGQSTATEVFNSWMNSEGHKKNILSPNFTQMAVAVYYDKNLTYQYYWAQLFIG